MKFLLSTGGELDNDFAGVLTSPSHIGVPAGIRAGAAWAADNEAFTRGFKPNRFFNWLETMKAYRQTCLFVTVPDVVSNALATMDSFRWWAWRIKALGFPIAFVAQDGQEYHKLPPEYDALFVGGSTAWKESAATIRLIKQAQAENKHIHIGRVNWARRYTLFRQIRGSERFTCDGTRQKYEGIERTKDAWSDYQRRLVLPLW